MSLASLAEVERMMVVNATLLVAKSIFECLDARI